MREQGFARLARCLFFVMFAVLASCVPSLAAPPAPMWIPGQPMMMGNQALLMWMPIPGAVKYNIYLNGKKTMDLTANQAIIPLGEGVGEFNFEVTAVDASGAEGAKSAPGVIKVTKLEPVKEIFVRLNERDKVISLRWNAPAGAVIFDVLRAQGKSENFQLIASVQSDQFQDTKVELGRKYFYQIVAKDISGKASPPSKPVDAELKVVVEVVRKKVGFKGIPTEPVANILFLGDKEITQVGDMRLHPKSGKIWLTEVNHKTIYEINGKGEVEKKHGPFDDLKTPNKFDFRPDGKVVLSDALGGKIVCFDPDTDAILWSAVIPKHDLNDEAYWKNLPSLAKGWESVAGDVLCLEKEIWVTDQRWGSISVFDYDGKFLRDIYTYMAGSKKERFPAVGEIGKVDNGRLYITFSLNHYLAVVDRDLKAIYEIGKASSGFVGGFIGIHGVDVTKEGNLLVTDPGVSSIQLFDGKTGDYIAHYGTTGQEDKNQPGRAELDFSNPNFGLFDMNGNIWVFAANEKAIVVRKPKSK